MSRSATRVCAWLALLATGCAGPRPAAVEYRPGHPAETRTVRGGGDYLLFHDDGPSGERVVTRRAVDTGAPIGFALDAAGLVAVAGPERIPLGGGRYRWQAEPHDRGWHERLTALGRPFVDPFESVSGYIAIAAIVGMAGMFVYGLCDPKAVGMSGLNFR